MNINRGEIIINEATRQARMINTNIKKNKLSKKWWLLDKSFVYSPYK